MNAFDKFHPPPDGASPAADHALLLPLLALPDVVRSAVEQRLAVPQPSGATGVEVPAPGWMWAPLPFGGAVLVERPGAGAPARPWLVIDREGWIHHLTRWAEGGRLQGAALRLPSGGWVRVIPGGATHPLWGASDRIDHHAGEQWRMVGRFGALYYGRIQWLPPLDRPGDLPPGAGEAVLNWLALLLSVRGVEAIHYRGRYPTEALFRALERSFVCGEPGEAGLAAFTRDALSVAMAGRMVENSVAWRPRPFAPRRAAPEVWVHARDEPESVWFAGVPFRLTDSAAGESGLLPAGERAWREIDGTYGVGLTALGTPLRQFLSLDGSGNVTGRPQAPFPVHVGAAVPVDPSWREVVTCWAALQGTPALAPALLEVGGAAAMGWARLPASLAALRAGGLVVQSELVARYREMAASPAAAGQAALMLISDVLTSALPHLRRLAQLQVEARGLAPSLEAVERAGAAAQTEARRRLERALPELTRAVAEGRALPGTSPPERQAARK